MKTPAVLLPCLNSRLSPALNSFVKDWHCMYLGDRPLGSILAMCGVPPNSTKRLLPMGKMQIGCIYSTNINLTTHNHAPISISTLGTSLLGATDDLIEVCGISNYNPQLEIWFTTFYTLITDFQIAGLIPPVKSPRWPWNSMVSG